MFCILLGELQSHFKQLLLELFVEGNLASIHGAGYEAYRQVGVVRQRKIQEVKPGKATILLLQLNLYECVICKRVIIPPILIFLYPHKVINDSELFLKSEVNSCKCFVEGVT